METIEIIKSVLGWAIVLNFSLLIVTSIILITAQGPTAKIHSKMFNIAEEELGKLYFNYLTNIKILTLVFFVMPYLGMCILGI